MKFLFEQVIPLLGIYPKKPERPIRKDIPYLSAYNTHLFFLKKQTNTHTSFPFYFQEEKVRVIRR